jgi:serine/threonine protein phosphatase PrpC
MNQNENLKKDTEAASLILGDEEKQSKRQPVWLTKEPTEPWCPDQMKELLGFEVEYKHELCVHKSSLSPWMVTAATKRGRSHAHHGTFREDAYAWKKENMFAIYCVCDGAGSATFSRIGSELATRSICRVASEALLSNQDKIQACSAASLHTNLKAVLEHAVSVTADKIHGIAEKSGAKPKDYRCTILTALHYKHASGGFFVFGNVGDGFMGVKRRGRAAERLGISHSGDFSGEVLCFMPDAKVGEFYKNSLDSIPMLPDEEVEAVLLCTDGIEDPFYPAQKNIDPLYRHLEGSFEGDPCGIQYPDEARPAAVFASANPGEELLKWLNFAKRGENDDRTIMVVHNRDLPKADQASAPAAAQEMAPNEIVANEIPNPSQAQLSGKTFIPLVVLALLVGFFCGFVVGRFTSIGASLGILNGGEFDQDSSHFSFNTK